MPKLWNDTIEKHRRDVREAILRTTWRLVSEHGLLSVTMSRIAEETGIGRATLYNYFPDVEAILTAHHERHIAEHLAQLAELRDQDDGAGERLEAVLLGYARICYFRGRHHAEDLGALLHRGEQITRAEQQLHRLFRELLAEVAANGELRTDVSPDELASYCLHALSAAGGMSSEDAVARLVRVTMAALRPS